MYNNACELLALTKANEARISDIVLDNECKITEKTRQEIWEHTRKILQVMQDSSNEAQQRSIVSISGLSGGDATKMAAYRQKGRTICGDTVNLAIARALSCSEINASMGRIVAAPTAGSCGIVPAAVITTAELIESGASARENLMIAALLTASGVGQIIAKNATLSGAEGGCQAECGSASAMAAAALVEMLGGTPEMSFHAAAITLMNILGLVCDPVAGLVELPCAYRNAMGVLNAMSSADMALAGVRSIIPFDEVVDAMYKVGKSMPAALRETGLGGLAATPTAIKLAKELLGR